MPFSTVYLDKVDKLGVGLRRSLMNDMSTTLSTILVTHFYPYSWSQPLEV
jgi:hypothetical protein